MAGLILYVAGALATWRLSSIIIYEEGPFSLFERFRSWVPMGGKWGWVGRGVYCLWCVSFWIGLVLAVPATYPQGSIYEWVTRSVIIGLSWSTISIFLEILVKHASSARG